MKRQEWLNERKTYIGGSDIASIIGVSPWKTALELYQEKIDGVTENDNNYTEWGTLLEPVVADMYSKNTGNKVVEPIGLIRHKEYPFLAANIDRFVNGGEYILECKTAGFPMRSKWGQEGTDDIPQAYYSQVAYYAAISDVPKVDIAVLIGGNDFRIYRYMRNREVEDKLLKIAINFWNNHILTKTPPEASNLNDLDLLYPKSKASEIVLSDEVLNDIEKYKALKAQIKELEKETTYLQGSIKKYMQDNELLVDTEGQVYATWKMGKVRETLDTKKLQSERQDIYQQYLKESKAPRVLRLK